MKELALHILDIAENSVAAGATVIVMELVLDNGQLTLGISDDGAGMDQDTLQRTADPFFTSRSTRRVGLGIPLLRQHAEMAGGRLEIVSERGKGTRLKADFIAAHPDLQPVGDLGGVWWLLASANPGVDVRLQCKTDKGFFEIGSVMVKEELEMDRLYGIELGEQLKRMIRNNLDDMRLTTEMNGPEGRND